MSQIIHPYGNDWMINTVRNKVGRFMQIGFTSTTGWPTANKAFYVHIRIEKPFLLGSLWWINGNNATGNADVGIFDGTTYKKLASSGSTARSGTSVLQKVSVGPILLPPGDYLLGHAASSTSGVSVMMSVATQLNCDLGGVTEEAAAFPLPATATPVQTTAGFVAPMIGGYNAFFNV